jgi:spore coat polysaccharide biosynthesis protein SpsF
VYQVVVATSAREIDDVIVQYVHGQGYQTFRGDAENVALRAVDACERFGWDGFARICGDRPFFNPGIVDHAVTIFMRGEYDLVTTSGGHPLPPGLTVEIVRCSALKAHLDDFSHANKEHLTSFFYEHLDKFTICYADHPSLDKARFNTRLVVDDAADLSRAEWIATCIAPLGPAAYSDSKRVLKLACEWDANMLTSTGKRIT